jgi:hypothetical protein
MLNGYVMTFSHDFAVVKYENLGFVSFVYVFRVPIPERCCVLQVLGFFKMQTSEEGSFRVSADVDKFHLNTPLITNSLNYY